ncbi:hypothetical protein [Pendulispora albinea]|uniref:Tetratricopeptide repeat protein n=1 Tax=Pendulispora albinea TaxID=2741071 RepID=A0ABZ2LSK7_9BACT
MMDPITAEIIDVVGVLRGGDRTGARIRFADLWLRVQHGDAFHRCVLCHYMADAQDEVEKELHWDQLALHAASFATEAQSTRAFEGVTLASFFPELHLNLAADYEKLGDLELARFHVLKAREKLGGLPDSELVNVTRMALERLDRRLG